MHQIKVLDLPFGKFRDKGIPVDNVSNFDSTKEEAVYLCEEEQLRCSMLLFATRQGMVQEGGRPGIPGGQADDHGHQTAAGRRGGDGGADP